MANANEENVHWTSGINVIAGVWLIIAPFVLGYAALEAILWNDVIIGAAVAAFALFRTSQPNQFESLSWINFVLGIWLIIAPFIIGHSALGAGEALWNDIIIGVIIVALAAWSATSTHKKPVS